jgi:hypothetical protein
MPAPTLQNDWRFQVSQSFAAANPAAMRQALMRGLKNSLIGVGSWTDDQGVAASVTSPWAVVRSSDAVSAANSDLWDADADLVWAAEAVAHSWVVLVNANYFGVANPLYMLINLNPSGTQNATIMMSFSRAGYTGGTASARPTATDEHIVRPVAGSVSTAGWQGDDNSTISVSMRLHVIMTDDGRKFKIYFTRNSVCIAKWELFDIDEDEAGWTEPYCFQIVSEDFTVGAEIELMTFANVASDATFNWYARQEGGVGDFRLEHFMPCATSFIAGNCIVGSSLNGFNGRWMPMPIFLRGVSPAASAPLAVVPDSWWARTAEGTGSPMRDDVAEFNQFMQFGTEMVPWNGSTIVLG